MGHREALAIGGMTRIHSNHFLLAVSVDHYRDVALEGSIDDVGTEVTSYLIHRNWDGLDFQFLK